MQFKFLNVDRREHVELHQALGEHNGVFEVVPVPRHERHGHVGSKRKLPHFCGSPVGQHLSLRHRFAHAHQRPLVDGGVLIGTPVLLQPVPIQMAQTRQRTAGINGPFNEPGVHDDLVRRDAGHHACTTGNDDGAGVNRHRGFEAGSNKRRARIQQRDRLTLHVRAHQRAVGVVVLKERNERRGDGHQLFRRHVHVVDIGRRREREVATFARQHQIIDERAVWIELGICLRDDGVFFAVGVQPHDFTRHAAVLHDTIRRFDKAEIVYASVAGERRDQTDVRTFRRLNGTHPAVLRVMHVSHFEAGALTR